MKKILQITIIALTVLAMTVSCKDDKKSNNGGSGNIKVNEFLFGENRYYVDNGRQDFAGAKYGEGTRCVSLIIGETIKGFHLTMDLFVGDNKIENGVYNYSETSGEPYWFRNAKLGGAGFVGTFEAGITDGTLIVSTTGDGKIMIKVNCTTDVEDAYTSTDKEKKYKTVTGTFLGKLPWYDAVVD